MHEKREQSDEASKKDSSYRGMYHGGAMIDCCVTTMHYSSRGGRIDPSSGGIDHLINQVMHHFSPKNDRLWRSRTSS
uniref:Leucyl/phenylalanyl-tRNA--protein transferase n=1 Tax=Jaagichlorella roystonensis TaxID=1052852 RepID=A0A6C0M6P8_9CHLO|nr:leucyl/phenylalanyl-tRNA--protein transferase [Jaagichlorella roystonensis]QHU78326.1 leucyl/phenylalanyl-tRNA--protein transferase [Jaagichlorella roystonensis]